MQPAKRNSGLQRTLGESKAVFTIAFRNGLYSEQRDLEQVTKSRSPDNRPYHCNKRSPIFKVGSSLTLYATGYGLDISMTDNH